MVVGGGVESGFSEKLLSSKQAFQFHHEVIGPMSI